MRRATDLDCREMIAPESGFFLHASAVEMENRAILFLGHSTSGKSTICNMMARCCRPIADDVVFVYTRDDQGYYVTNGKKRFAEFESFRLVGNMGSCDGIKIGLITRIYKANELSIESISQRQLCRFLADSLFEVDIQRQHADLDIRKRLFTEVSRMARVIKGRSMNFSLQTNPKDIMKELTNEN